MDQGVRDAKKVLDKLDKELKGLKEHLTKLEAQDPQVRVSLRNTLLLSLPPPLPLELTHLDHPDWVIEGHTH